MNLSTGEQIPADVPEIRERRTAAIAYLAGSISGALLLASGPASRFVRFHAAQSLVTFLILGTIAFALGSIPRVGWMADVALAPITAILWGILLVSSWRGRVLRLPMAGGMADRLISRYPDPPHSGTIAADGR